MKLIKKDGIYIAECSFEERGLPKAANFRWNPTEKLWWTDSKEKAAKLAAHADDELRGEFVQILEERKKSIEASSAFDSDVVIPAPEGLNYLGYQRAGIAYGMKRTNVLIADDMGLGKTIQGIGICNADPNAKNVLIICPASLKLNWKREFEKWDVKGLTVDVVMKGFCDTDVVIINYDILKKFRTEIRARKWDVLIADEAHALKNPKAQRTCEVFGKKGKKKGDEVEESIAAIEAGRKVFLTGTPILNRPAESWTLCHNLAPDVFKSWGSFMIRYAAGERTRFGWDVSGASNLDELQEKLRTSIMVRRLKSDVLKELPAKRRQIIELQANGASEIIKKEKEAWKSKDEVLRELMLQVELAKAGTEDEYKMAVMEMQAGMQAAFTEMAKMRHDVAMAKVPYAIEHIESAIESGKVIVFAHHKDVVEEILKAFPGISVSVTGSTPIVARQEAVDRFQKDEKIKLFVGNIKAAGVGLTLTASSHVIFVELDWVPGIMTQAEDRAHRIGQLNSVLVQLLVLESSLDVEVAQSLIAKQEIIEQALDKGLKIDYNLPEKIDHVEPVTPVKVDEQAATKELTHKAVEELAVTMGVEEIELIHQGLKRLAAFCDGAQEIDGMGFNKLDTGIGKSLAYRDSLTPKQAVLGRRLVNKYRRQLSDEIIEGLGLNVKKPKAKKVK